MDIIKQRRRSSIRNLMTKEPIQNESFLGVVLKPVIKDARDQIEPQQAKRLLKVKQSLDICDLHLPYLNDFTFYLTPFLSLYLLLCLSLFSYYMCLSHFVTYLTYGLQSTIFIYGLILAYLYIKIF